MPLTKGARVKMSAEALRSSRYSRTLAEARGIVTAADPEEDRFTVQWEESGNVTVLPGRMLVRADRIQP